MKYQMSLSNSLSSVDIFLPVTVPNKRSLERWQHDIEIKAYQQVSYSIARLSIIYGAVMT